MRLKSNYSFVLGIALLAIACSETAPTDPSEAQAAQGIASAGGAPERTHKRMNPDSLWEALKGSDSIAVIGLKHPGTSRGSYGEIFLNYNDATPFVRDLGVSGVTVLERDTLLPVLLAKIYSRHVVATLLNLPFIDYIEPVAVPAPPQGMYADPYTCSTDGGDPPLASWTESHFQPGSFYDDVLSATFLWHQVDLAWSRSQGRGIKVGVVDTGIDPNQYDLTGAYSTMLSTGRSADYFYSSPSDGTPRWKDDCGHGTRVAGVALAPLNGNSTVGVAWGANLISVRQDDDVAMVNGQDAATAIRIAGGNGARVIVMAWQSSDWLNRVEDEIRMWHDSPRERLLIAVAGTSICDAWGRTYVMFPGQMREILTVTAVDESGDVACRAHYGSEVDVTGFVSSAAPGAVTLGAPNIASIKGSSGAAGMIAGIAALVWSTDPSMHRDEVVRRLQEAGANYPTRSFRVGYGAVDAYAAVGGIHRWEVSTAVGNLPRRGVPFEIDVVVIHGGTPPWDIDIFVNGNLTRYSEVYSRSITHAFIPTVDFTLRATITDPSDGVTLESDGGTRDVMPAPTASIVGPSSIESSGQHTYSAGTSGFLAGTAYRWEYADCANCSWIDLGSGPDISQNFYVECTGASDPEPPPPIHPSPGQTPPQRAEFAGCQACPAEPFDYLRVRVTDVYNADVVETKAIGTCPLAN